MWYLLLIYKGKPQGKLSLKSNICVPWLLSVSAPRRHRNTSVMSPARWPGSRGCHQTVLSISPRRREGNVRHCNCSLTTSPHTSLHPLPCTQGQRWMGSLHSRSDIFPLESQPPSIFNILIPIQTAILAWSKNNIILYQEFHPHFKFLK